MKLTKNFKLTEFGCKDGSGVPERYIDNCVELAENLQKIRDYFGRPVIINSAYRTKSHNAKVGGATSSKHLTCSAADIRIEGVETKVLHDAVLTLIERGEIKQGGVGIYNSFVHYDIRGYKARWDFR